MTTSVKRVPLPFVLFKNASLPTWITFSTNRLAHLLVMEHIVHKVCEKTHRPLWSKIYLLGSWYLISCCKLMKDKTPLISTRAARRKRGHAQKQRNSIFFQLFFSLNLNSSFCLQAGFFRIFQFCRCHLLVATKHWLQPHRRVKMCWETRVYSCSSAPF